MFDEMNYAPSQEVRSISQQIAYLTGKTDTDTEDYSGSEGNIGVDDETTTDSSGTVSDGTTN